MVVYATTDGYTRKVALRVAGWCNSLEATADVVDSAELPVGLNLSEYTAFILAGSVHESNHQRSLVEFVSEHAKELGRVPSAFLSVSLSAVTQDDKHRADAQRCIEAFFETTGWTPTVSTPVAGALLYTQYHWLKRTTMKAISAKQGGDTDTTRDFEYTDWGALEVFVTEFVKVRVAVAT